LDNDFFVNYTRLVQPG